MTRIFESGRQRPRRGPRTGRLACVLALLVGGLSMRAPIQAQQPPSPQPPTASASPAAAPATAAAGVDLTNAIIIGPASPGVQEQTALRVLVEEVEKRTLVRLPLDASRDAARPRIIVGTRDALRGRAGDISGGLPSGPAPGPEGYILHVDAARQPAAVFVIGADARGMLFGVGRLLRELDMTRGRVSVRADLRLATAPEVAMRGHQLGYRPKTNSYDAFTVAMWDQYIRDLAIFGTNAIELIPPRSDDDADSPHFPLPPMQMMIEMSRIIDRYGLDVWIWYPALDKDYTDPAQVEFALKEWADVFRQLPRIDAILVPGGDPGHTKPDAMFALLEKQTASLHQYHPKAQMWLSPQGFTKDWMEEFYGLMDAQPRWLTGIVFGPQVRDDLPTLRKRIPARYRIRRYPDITHTIRAEYGVPDWDLAHALTSSREPINPRPIDQATIFRSLHTSAPDFITYSEGINDDVNKIVWSGLGWDPDADVVETLRQYGRYFIGPRYTDAFAQGLLALERNWRGPLLSNDGVYTTLQQFQRMERTASPQDLLNWRFQQALYRAYYDAYQRARLIAETAQEDRAMERLRSAKQTGALTALADAENALREADASTPAADWRQRVYALAEALYQSARMQLSVEKYKAIGVDRGATLDTAESPLNNRAWLFAELERIRQVADEPARVKEIEKIVAWTDPGPGGYYDDLGNAARQPHLVRPAEYDRQAGGRYLPGATGFGRRPGWRLSWMTHAETYYDRPLTLKYDGLDANARYRLRVVYAGDIYSTSPKIRVTANDGIEVAPFTAKPLPIAPLAWPVPPQATRGGSLTLTFATSPGIGGSGRGVQVAEVWLIREGVEQ